MNGMRLIEAERQRQIEVEGWTAGHDEQHSPGDLADAAHCYVLAQGPDAAMPAEWPWGAEWWKPKDRQRNLVRAGALYLAAADRCDRSGRIGRSNEMHDLAEMCAKTIDALLANT